MTPTESTRELVLLRLDQPFGEFLSSLLPQSAMQAILFYPLAAAALVALVVWVGRRIVRGPSRPGPLWTACVLSWVAFGLVLLGVFFVNDSFPAAGNFAGEIAAGKKQQNTVLWLVFTAAVFTVGTGYALAMYNKDRAGTRWYFAAALAAVRVSVYAVLCLVFLLPAFQTYERTEKRSRVLVVIDVSGSMHKDEDASGAPGAKPKSRVGQVIEFLTDSQADFLGKLLDKNPVFVYRFGTRADEDPQEFQKGNPAWAAADWDAFAKYDFKPVLLKGLSPEGTEAVKTSAPWNGAAPGTPEWAAGWLARAEDEAIPKNMPEPDREALKQSRGRLERRLDVARTIAAGTNVPASLLTLVNREAANMVQGVVVFTDGRSNLASDSAYAELRARASREKVPVFTVAVGEDRVAASIAVSDVQAPGNTPPDEPFKVVVEADGQNLANTETDVFLDLFLPNRNPETDPADHTLQGKLTFLPGDPPHGQAEFVIDPAKLPDNLTTEPKEGTSATKRQLREGAWSMRGRIPKHKLESAAATEHVRVRPNVQVARKPLRILLWASGPTREYLQLKTVLIREAQESRAELSVCLQNEAGEKGTAVQDVPPERLLARFPTKLDLATKGGADPKERFNNLNEYDLVVAFDPDWSEVSAEQADILRRWVQEQGGGFVYVAGPLHTFQLARVEPNSRLSPVLEVLPVVPEDIIVIRARGTPRTPRRLDLKPPEESDVLKLLDTPGDPKAGWEKFFTDREKYVASPDLKVELYPRRGFFSAYPVKDIQETRRSSKVLAELIDEDDKGDRMPQPWLVSSNPSAAWRSLFVGSGELYRLNAFDPPEGKEMYKRAWVQLMRYAAAKRDTKAARGRLLLGEVYTAGNPIRVQARVLDPTAKPYPVGGIDPRFKVIRLSAENQPEKEFGPFPLAARQGATGFDGYYQGQLTPDPREMPPGEKRYRVVIDVPDSAGETIEGEFQLRASNPELDNIRPDPAALMGVATEFDGDNGVAARVTNPDAKARLIRELPRDGGVSKLAFKLTDRELLGLIPECMGNREVTAENRGKADDLWDRGFEVPLPPSDRIASWFGRPPYTVSYVLLLVVLLLCVEWTGRKLLRLA
ncbi:hypothetical protein [Urbifossiella limnaea]|uniref:VWA domain-containing protein n=1 Tax=Urbifossiella limnaea TaxID=2528023 RepID=A0A517XPT8_9BACT|nr:hypothetical protein [Urbifossiella limnaea]QDU19506.1 hypothetical protein ETAA1_14350 [Urbifossiella limnaea]